MKKSIMKVFCITMTITLFICSCSSNQGNTVKPSEISETIKSWFLNEYLANGKRNIWYDVKAEDGIIGKDSDILNIYVFQDGQVTVYTKNDAEQVFDASTLGMVAKLTDDEIVEKLEEGNKKALQEELDNCIASFESLENRDSYEQELLDFYKSYSITDSQPDKYAIGVETDETGNATQKETIYYLDKKQDFYDFESLDDLNDQEKKIEYVEEVKEPAVVMSDIDGLTAPISDIQVYDSRYTGFARDKIEYFFVTRMDSETILCLDEPIAKDVYIDTSDSDIEKELLK